MKIVFVLMLGVSLSLFVGCKRDNSSLSKDIKNDIEESSIVDNVSLDKSKLTKSQSDVTEKIKLEKPFDNKYWDNKAEGIYVDAISGEALFLSKDKYDSGTGWPSFTKPIDKKMVTNILSNKDGVNKTDVKNSTTNTHLGNLYYDGPKDRGGTRYCLYSSSLRFVPTSEMASEGYGYLLSQVSK